jgi:dTDP-4-dehydrorhamnose 3,5-epimerase
MPFTETDFPGLLIFEPRVFNDDRGYFFESYNQARSTYGVIRGLHFQLNPNAQTKLIRSLSGTILDVVVDLRAGSPTFGKYFSIELSAENKKQLLVPRGFAHGYSVLSETAEVLYKCDGFYQKESEGGLMYNDSTLNIDWKVPAGKQMVAAKDLVLPDIENCKTNFTI